MNDVVLAAVSGGYRALLLRRGDNADRAVVRSLVPVSTRHDDGQGVADNRVSALLYELPVRIADPVERLEAVRNQMTKLRRPTSRKPVRWSTSIGDFVPARWSWAPSAG